MTGKKDIPIDADVCADTVTGYDWEGIQLFDTPGVHAGYTDHDETTYQTIAKADLLVFVITGELFDDLMGEHFRNLAFIRDKAAEILFVVNKMGMVPGTPEIKLPDIGKVTEPRSPKDFGTVFIDVQFYLEGIEETVAEDRKDLLDITRFDDFVAALNSYYVQDHGYAARLTTPLFHEGSFARQLRGQIETAFVRERGSDRNTEGFQVEWTAPSGTTPSEWSARLQKAGNVAQTIGKYVANWTTGPFATTARLGSATAARGSQAHHVIYYSAGKFFGVKFKSWDAVKATRYLGNAGRVIGAAGAILAIVAQIKEEEQQEQHKRELRDARDSVRPGIVKHLGRSKQNSG